MQSPNVMLKPHSLLETVFHFNCADLYDNRNGRISDRQKIRLRWMQVLSPWHVLTVLFVGIHLIIIFHLLILIVSLLQAHNWLGVVRLLAGTGILTLAIIYLIKCLIERLKRLRTDIQNGWVKTKTGRITFRRYRIRRISVAYLMQIEGESYKITCWQMLAFHKQRKYHIYIAPQMKLVLSAEPVHL